MNRQKLYFGTVDSLMRGFKLVGSGGWAASSTERSMTALDVLAIAVFMEAAFLIWHVWRSHH